MEGYLALLSLFSGLFVAPLILGSQIVLQGAGRLLTILWLGFLGSVLLVSLIAGVISLWLLLA